MGTALVVLLVVGCGDAPLELPAHELRFVTESLVMPSGMRALPVEAGR